MTFKVKDLMVNVGPVSEASTCTGWTRPTGGGCLESLFDHAEQRAARSNLSALRAQLRQAVARA